MRQNKKCKTKNKLCTAWFWKKNAVHNFKMAQNQYESLK